MRRRVALIAASALVVLLAMVQTVGLVAHALSRASPPEAGLAAVPHLLRASDTAQRTLDPYRGPGAWVDMYDVAGDGDTAPVTPDAIDEMADVGVRTLYLQAARDDRQGGPAELYDPGLLGRFLVRAHQRGMQVVGWYLPRFGDVARDLAHLEAIADFEVMGHRFDGVAVDIEWTDTVPDDGERSARLVELSQALRDTMGSGAVGAIVMPPAHLEAVNPGFWPGFPWDELAPLYDVWLPMAYWTQRSAASGYRDAATYTTDNLRRLRGHLGDDVPVHMIGGLGEDTTAGDLAAFVASSGEGGAIGASIYDWATSSADAHQQLSDGVGPR